MHMRPKHVRFICYNPSLDFSDSLRYLVCIFLQSNCILILNSSISTSATVNCPSVLGRTCQGRQNRRAGGAIDPKTLAKLEAQPVPSNLLLSLIAPYIFRPSVGSDLCLSRCPLLFVTLYNERYIYNGDETAMIRRCI